MANATEPMASKISSCVAEPVNCGHEGEQAIVRFAKRWSRFHFETALGYN